MSRISPLIVASSVLLLSACATQDFVKETVAPVQTSVDGLGTRVQAHDDGLKALDGRLQGSEARIQALQQEAIARAEAAKKLPAPSLLMSTMLTDDKVKFSSGRAQLTEQAGRELDQLVAKLKADNQPVFVEIQGHTDSTGSNALNQQLGLQRAEAVRLYLSHAGLPLARMATISYGETAPLADNNTREGRSTNRRVQLIVMRPDGHPKLLHSWPPKLLQAGRGDYVGSEVMSRRAEASLSR
ncbi:OmpA family protein [Roseateles saccharophilus]|uniref:Outer membrane protein OmpA-like peptidoglycan-associated protein n=1 Tax=Roseateles saccharophilus TaxID=304 RepID=A0A4R3UAN2_ROSSA|nr:OmpA family protein [Roseateles saccharophilus]MDG0835551.1 OmpA family protein [Roseateles saccharophilus]TCU85464.1 outer membrane protein OmpA-like peptidoglycan-associated protein [Roseateles saccharophilus]